MKEFWGYKNKEEALEQWPEEILEAGVKTTKNIDVVDDPTVWPQTSSKKMKVTRINLPFAVIGYEEISS